VFVAAASGTHATYDVCIRLVPGDAVGPRPVPRHRIRLVGGETRRGPSDHQPPAEMRRSIHEVTMRGCVLNMVSDGISKFNVKFI